MTAQDIASSRLFAQRLAGEGCASPAAAVAWLGAVQAQDYAGAKWGLGQRVPGSTDAEIDDAFARGAILRTHLLRPTWHFVTPADIRWLLALTAPRVQKLNASMYRKLDFDSAALTRSNTALLHGLEGGRQLTRDELRPVLQAAGLATDGDLRMSYLLMNAELEGLICSGARQGKQFTYALLDERVPATPVLDRTDALAELAFRFFTSRGPATVQDFAKWSGLTVKDARAGLESVRNRLDHPLMAGKQYAAAIGTAVERPAGVNVHLLSIYDEYVSGYKDRSAIGSPEIGARLMALGNALSYIVVVNGRIVGTWKRKLSTGSVVLDLDLMTALSKSEQRAVHAAVEKYGAFLGLTASAE